MAAAAILNLLLSPILVTWTIFSCDWLHFCKIALNYFNRPLSYYFLCKNQDGGRRSLGFYFCSIL